MKHSIITSQQEKLHRGRYTQNLHIYIEFHPIQNIQKRKNNRQQIQRDQYITYNNQHNRRKKISPKEQIP